MTDSLHRDIRSAIQDAGVSRDERGLMPLSEARALVASLVVYAKATSETSNVLGSDLAWAALLSLADADEFLAAALRIRWQFHVRGRDNVAAYARFGDAILPWIASAVSADGTLRNVPWCLYPCLMAMGTAEAFALALSIRAIDGSLEGAGEGEVVGEGGLNLGLGAQWLGTDMAGRLPLVASLAAGDERAKALLASTVANLGLPRSRCSAQRSAVRRRPKPRSGHSESRSRSPIQASRPGSPACHARPSPPARRGASSTSIKTICSPIGTCSMATRRPTRCGSRRSPTRSATC